MARLLTIDPARPEPDRIQAVLAVLEQGLPVVVPTETVYGLACRPDLPDAEQRVYAVKERPENKPLPRMTASVEQVRAQTTGWPDGVDRIARRFWPGPLTLILPTAGGTRAFRIPDHPVLLALLAAAPAPLAVTSANLSGGREARSAAEAAAELGDRVTLIVDAGPARIGQASTIVDLCHGPPRILRAGAISEQALLDAWQEPGPAN